MVKACQILSLLFIIFGLGGYYIGNEKIHGFMYQHYFLWDKIKDFCLSYLVYTNTTGFVRYAFCALCAFLALRVYWGILDDINSRVANADDVIYPLYAMLIIVSFGILTTSAEWEHRRVKTL